jgi:hypothetical protein
MLPSGRSNIWLIVIPAFVLTVVGALAVWAITMTKNSGIDFDGPITKLWEDYQDDMLKADVTYKGKRLQLHGIKGKVQKVVDGRYMMVGLWGRSVKPPTAPLPSVPGRQGIAESGRNARHVALNSGTEPAVLLYLDENDLASFVGVSDQTEISVIGICRGTTLEPGTIPNFMVIVDNCRLAK